jgi:hypothetical protein
MSFDYKNATYSTSKIYCIRDIYNIGYNPLIDPIPVGYEVIDFRPPLEAADIYLGVDGIVWAATKMGLDGTIKSDNVGTPKTPRLILKKKEIRKWVFVETGEFRRVKPGEWYLNGLHIIMWPCGMSYNTHSEFRILKAIEVPPEST